MRCTYCSTRPAISRPPDRSQARKKVAVLLPLLALVDLLFLVVLRTLGRPPAAGDYGRRS
jgi:hypothetical protein